jgi:hypothetical protein
MVGGILRPFFISKKGTKVMAQMPIPDDWDGVTTCRWSVCWPNSSQWFAILNGLVGTPLQGRFWDAGTGSIVNVQSAFREIYDYNFNLREVIMACGDTGLSDLAAAVRLLAQNQCCNGVTTTGGVTVTITSPEGAITPIYGSAPPGSLPGGEVPSGYPGNLEDYNADKCRTSAAIILAWVASMRNLAYVNWLENTALVAVVLAAVAGLIVLPEFLIPILIAAAIGQVGLQSALLSLADGIEANFDDWVCYLYRSESTEVVLGYVSDALDAVIAAIPATGALGWALKTIALVLMNTDTLNKLFTLNQGYGAPYTCTCSDAPCAFGFDTDAQGWSWEQIAGPAGACSGSWSDLFNSEGGISSVLNSANGSGTYTLAWNSPILACGGDTLTMAYGSNYTGLNGSWSVVATYSDESVDTETFSESSIFSRVYMSLDALKTVVGVQVKYTASPPSTGYDYSQVILDLSIYTA